MRWGFAMIRKRVFNRMMIRMIRSSFVDLHHSWIRRMRIPGSMSFRWIACWGLVGLRILLPVGCRSQIVHCSTPMGGGRSVVGRHRWRVGRCTLVRGRCRSRPYRKRNFVVVSCKGCMKAASVHRSWIRRSWIHRSWIRWILRTHHRWAWRQLRWPKGRRQWRISWWSWEVYVWIVC